MTNRVIYDAAGTGRSCQNDNNRVKMRAVLDPLYYSRAARPESSVEELPRSMSLMIYLTISSYHGIVNQP